MQELSKYLHDPLVLFVAAGLYVFGRDIAVRFLRKDGNAKLTDTNPNNDALGRAELAAADAVEKLPSPIPGAKR